MRSEVAIGGFGRSRTTQSGRKLEGHEMLRHCLPSLAKSWIARSWLPGLALGVAMMVVPASAEDLKSEIAPTGKLRVAIGISAAGGAFWSNKNEAGGYVGVPVDLGKEMAAELGVPVEYVAYPHSGQITDAASKGSWG